MRPSLRFLGLTMVGWAGVRAAAHDFLPGAEIFRIEPSEAKAPAIVPTQFPPIDPIGGEEAAFAADTNATFAPAAGSFPLPHAVPATAVYYVAGLPGARSEPTPLKGALPTPRPAPQFYSAIQPLDQWPVAQIAAVSMPIGRSSPTVRSQSSPVVGQPGRLDRLQLGAWAMLRPQQGGISSPQSLANGGTLGGSQAGARLNYNFTRAIAATFRTSSEVGRRGGEVAAGVRFQPVRGLPVWFNAERRQRLGKYGGGRNAFALFFEGGVYDRPMPWQLSLDAYLQGGVVGFHHRDRFIDGGLTLTRPVYRQFSAGFGLWGAAQPGVYRVDAGPRVSMRVRNNVKVHVDWRQRLAGNAMPGSGPAVTLAGDF
ncbi:MAG TPA: hypothetical protein VM145_08145 [Sphingomicrobium sp.]|nr:hypothetical protein [Sphingomicrobium sp.]